MVLKIVDDQGRVQERTLEGSELTIGRDPTCGLVLPERNVSRRHVRLFRKGEVWAVEDAGSRYGVYVNGDKLAAPTTLHDGDTLKVGDYAFAIEEPLGREEHTTSPGLDALDDDLSFDDSEDTGERPTPFNSMAETAPLPVQKPSDALAAEEPLPVRPASGDEGRPTAVVAVQPAPRPASRELQGVAVPPQFRMKLTGLSPAMQGSELVLERTVMTVGRTPENDLVVDHRSVSSTHARVAFENGHFIVYDQGSTNGVLVNGEPYQSCVLQYNDEIQFGHVKFRFVRPNDRLEPATPVVERNDGERAGMGIKLVALGVLVVASVLAGVLYVTKFSRDATEVGVETPAATAPAPAAEKPSTEPGAATPAKPGDRAQARLDEARKLFEAEKFGEARALLQEIVASTKDSPGLVSANALHELDRVGREEAAKKRFDEVVVLKAQDKTPEAYALLQEGKGEAPAATAYGKRLESMEDELRVAALATLVKRADQALQQQQADAALAAVKGALELSPDNSEALALLQRATDLKAAQDRKAEKAAPAAAPAPKPQPAPVAVAEAPRPAAAPPAPKAAQAPAPARVAANEPRPASASAKATSDKPAPKPAGLDPDAGLSGLDLFKKAIQAKSQGKLNEAKEYCYKATEKSYPAAHKMLGNIFQTELNFKKAAYHFRQYLAASPNAPDAAPIQTLIQQLESK